jgi:peptidoglycan/LPS O-acetylase OafA/YrhL
MPTRQSKADDHAVVGPSGPPARNAGLDALRASVTLLVLLHHTALTYGAIGGWFYREIEPDGSPSSMLLVFFCTLNQAWFMGLFFLLAGYFTPAALRTKGPWRFMADRLLRLGVPLLLFIALIGPLTIALAQMARGRPFAATLAAPWRHGTVETGPLWFALALLIFSAATALVHAAGPAAGSGGPVDRPFPPDRQLALAALAVGLAAFVLRLQWPVGRDLLGLQFGYFASYVALFAAGCLAAGPRWLERLPPSGVRRWRRVAWCVLPVLPIVSLAAPWVPAFQGAPQGGWNLQAAVYASWEPLVAWGVILGLLQRCQRRFQVLSGLRQALARRAYAIYVIHPPVLVAIALAWKDVPAPALLKFAVTGSLGCAGCFVLAGVLLKLPGARRVF